MSSAVSDLSLEHRVALMSPEERAEFLADTDMEDLEYDWHWGGRPSQILPITADDGDINWSVALALAGRGFGKLIAVATPIPTPAGWVMMGDLRPGDTVFDEHGQPTTVLRVFDEYPERAWRLTFSDGATLDVGGEHLWVTWTHADRKRYRRASPGAERFPVDWAAKPAITTDQLVATLRQPTGRADLNHCIPVAGPLATPAADLLIDPYVLGYWLGDGSSLSGSVTVADGDSTETLARIAALGYPATRSSRRPGANCATHFIGVRPESRSPITGRLQANGSLHSQLKAIGVLGNKHVPTSYLRSSIAQRMELLTGLMDSDGYVGLNGHVEFCSTSERLADAVLELARSLGQKPVKAKGRAMLRGVDHGPKYRVTWRPTDNPFRLARKAARVHPPGAQGMRNHHRMIVAADVIPVQPMRCITVDSPHSMYLVGEGMIPTHNTLMGAQWIRATDAAWRSMDEDTDHLRIALLGRTSADVRDTMLEGPSGLLSVYPPSVRDRVLWTPSRRRVELPNGGVVLCFSAEEPAQLRGPGFHRAWCDELATYKQVRSPDDDATAWENLRIAVRLGKHPQILATTTPKRVPVLRQLLAQASREPSKYLLRRGRTYDNKYLAAGYLDVLTSLYGGTSLGRQELEGEMLDDVAGAMTSEAIIERNRVRSLPPNIPWIKLVSVDPSVAERPNDECGIMVIYISRTWPVLKRHAFVVEDLSVRASPTVWADIAIRAAHEHQATIIAETNQGANLVFQMLRQAADHANLEMPQMKEVWSTKAKAVRAEPVGGAYALNRVHHVNVLSEYESQITTWTVNDGYSPDRMDAGVQGIASGMFPEALTSQGGMGPVNILTAARQHLPLTREAARDRRVDSRGLW